MSSRRKDSEYTRELILSTALRLFVERGYFATSVHDIRRAAGLSTGSIYHHFESKEALARALYDDLVKRMAEMVELSAASCQSAHDKGKAIAIALCSAAEESPELVHFILHARHREFLPEAPPICSTRPFELMKQVASDGITSGELRQMDTIVAGVALFGGVIRLLHLSLDGVLDKPLAGYLDDVWEAGWRGVSS
ncbi:MAG: TetR/AcrR family transcriptional regulator [Desulfuromonadaceae bacterium]